MLYAALCLPLVAIVLLVGLSVGGTAGNAIIGVGLVLVGALYIGIQLRRPDERAWSAWSNPRGMRSIDARSPRTKGAWEAVVGPRRIRVRFEVVEEWVGGYSYDDHETIIMYRVSTRLPEGAMSALPRSSLQPIGPIDNSAELFSGSRRLEVESERFNRSLSFRVAGGDDLDWYTLMDPAMVDLLGELPGVGWTHERGEIAVWVAVPERGVEHPFEATLDSLAVLVAAVERRVARIVGRGRAVDPAESGFEAAVGQSQRDRYLDDARRRDLEMTIEQQFAELAKYTSADEVERVRAAIDAGTFRVDQLDDLIYHRRARFWQADEDAA